MTATGLREQGNATYRFGYTPNRDHNGAAERIRAAGSSLSTLMNPGSRAIGPEPAGDGRSVTEFSELDARQRPKHGGHGRVYKLQLFFSKGEMQGCFLHGITWSAPSTTGKARWRDKNNKNNNT